MRVAEDELSHHVVGDIVGHEAAGFLFHVDVEEHLHQHIAELFFHQLGIVEVEGLGGLIRFFKEVAAVRLVRLLAVPRASARRAQNAQDVNKVVICVDSFLRIIYHIFPLIARCFAQFP